MRNEFDEPWDQSPTQCMTCGDAGMVSNGEVNIICHCVHVQDECSTFTREQYERMMERAAKLPPVHVVTLEADGKTYLDFENDRRPLYNVATETHTHVIER